MFLFSALFTITFILQAKALVYLKAWPPNIKNNTVNATDIKIPNKFGNETYDSVLVSVLVIVIVGKLV
jgi:hypothetical protein